MDPEYDGAEADALQQFLSIRVLLLDLAAEGVVFQGYLVQCHRIHPSVASVGIVREVEPGGSEGRPGGHRNFKPQFWVSKATSLELVVVTIMQRTPEILKDHRRLIEDELLSAKPLVGERTQTLGKQCNRSRNV